MSTPTNSPVHLRRLIHSLLFLSAIAWFYAAAALAASAASGLSFRLRLILGRPLLEAVFHLFLLVLGFTVLQAVARQGLTGREVTALPQRATAGREWLSGVALGWGIVLAVILSCAIFLRLIARITFGGTEVAGALLALATLAVSTFAVEMTFRGYPLRCLVRAVGPSSAVILMVLGSGLAASHRAGTPTTGVLAAMLLTALLSVSWLRTHAVWLAWGLHFAISSCVAVLFGLRGGEEDVVSSLVHGRLTGAEWVTGGRAGPMGSIFAVLAIAAGIVVLLRLTRHYAWSYTHSPIVAAGAPVIVAPPAAHLEMERQAAKAPLLVQILPLTGTPSTAQEPEVRGVKATTDHEFGG